MNDSSLKYKILAVAGLVAFSIFLLVPKPETWSEPTANKFLRKFSSLKMRLGIDLQGGTRLEYEIPERDQARFEGASNMVRMLQVLERRIDVLGVVEPKIESSGKFRFVIELPGIGSELVQRVKTLMEKQGKLEFKLTANLDRDPELKREDDRIRALISEIEANYPIDEKNIHNRYEQGEAVAREINQNRLAPRFSDQWRYYFHHEERTTGSVQDEYVLVENKVEISGTDIQTSSRSMHTLGPVPSFTLKPEARNRFCKITQAHKRGAGNERRLAIILDDRLVSAPGIEDDICSGQAIITGSFSEQEVDDMVNVFSSGSLPVVPNLLREETTGPSIGVAAQRAGIIAGVFGMALVLVFMFVYYLGAGVVANIALIVNGILLGGALTFFGATLTLPGIAGLILTIGMAVDANILIYERIREELAKGKTLSQAISNGYERALVTILDANITTLITATVLFFIGTGSVKGFATTLIIGILTSVFTAVAVTRLIFTALERTGMLTEMKMLDLVGTPKFDFMRSGKVFGMLSLALVIAGLTIFGARLDPIQGIDMKGGTAFRIAAETPMTGAQVSERLTAVNSQVDQWIAQNQWMDLLGIEQEAGAPAGVSTTHESPQRDPLLGVQPQGLFVDVGPGQTEPAKGTFYEFMVRSRTLNDTSFRLVEKALTTPTEGMVNMSVKEKTEISSKVARETAVTALVAILISIGFILLYITIRFEFQFGLGAVIALVHDVAISLGAIALCNASGLVDVEINLPIIAAILTIIGYSLNDTIVVFDRIRENLKGSHRITADLINSSVNQTLSRTLLTAGTTLVVVIVLFALNYGRGSIVEGFSFAIIIGLVVGTYSSIFIASPFLLWWQDRRAQPGKGAS